MTRDELAEDLEEQAKRLKSVARAQYSEIKDDSATSGPDYRARARWAVLTNVADTLNQLAFIAREGGLTP